MIDRLEETLKKYNEITEELTKEETLKNISLLTKLSKEQSDLSEIVEVYKNYKNILNNIERRLFSHVSLTIVFPLFFCHLCVFQKGKRQPLHRLLTVRAVHACPHGTDGQLPAYRASIYFDHFPQSLFHGY